MSTEAAGIVVFASGRGSNVRALCEAVRSAKLPARIVALVTNVAGAGALEVAREFGVPCVVVESRGRTREEHERLVLEALSGRSFEWIVLAGYMRLFSADFIRRFHDPRLGCARVVNIHPSLLPAFPGVESYAQALRHGVKITGVTVHLVGEGLDDGPIAAQASLEVGDAETVESLTKRGLALEHELYPRTLARLLRGRWQLGAGATGDGRPRVVFEEKAS